MLAHLFLLGSYAALSPSYSFAILPLVLLRLMITLQACGTAGKSAWVKWGNDRHA